MKKDGYYFEVVIFCNNVQKKIKSRHKTYETAVRKMNELSEESKKIKFKATKKNTSSIEDAYYSIGIVKEFSKSERAIVKNKYGAFSEYEVVSEKEKEVLCMEPYFIEEKFYVLCGGKERKRMTLSRICHEIVDPKCMDKYKFCQMILFKNKIIFNSSDDFSMVLCKDSHDSIKLYNKIEETYIGDKKKYFVSCGDWDSSIRKKKECVNLIASKTGWDRKKILRPKLSP